MKIVGDDGSKTHLKKLMQYVEKHGIDETDIRLSRNR